MTQRQVNLNDEVWVKLTPDGIATYNADPVRKKIREEMPKYAIEVQEGDVLFTVGTHANLRAQDVQRWAGAVSRHARALP